MCDDSVLYTECLGKEVSYLCHPIKTKHCKIFLKYLYFGGMKVSLTFNVPIYRFTKPFHTYSFILSLQ